jgi:hypothetical protein
LFLAIYVAAVGFVLAEEKLKTSFSFSQVATQVFSYPAGCP